MKTIKRLAMLAAATIACASAAMAQYYQMANQLTDMLSTALSAGNRYRGFVEASYQRGLGDRSADIWEFTTTQGAKYTDWFFLGVGAGVDLLHANVGDNPLTQVDGKQITNNGCMIPLYSDFRFNIGGQQTSAFFIDCRIGASFLVGKSHLQVGDGYLNRSECFYLRPSLGLRLPISKANPKLAMNVGASYTLICTDYWYSSASNIAMSSLGINVAFEW